MGYLSQLGQVSSDRQIGERCLSPPGSSALQGACVVCAAQLVTALAQGWFRQVSWWLTIVNLHPSLPVSVLQGHLWCAGHQAKWCCSSMVWTVNPAMSWLWRSTSCSWLRPTHWSTQWYTPAEMLRCAGPFAASSAACSSAGPTTNLPDTHLLPRRVPAPGSCFLRTVAHQWTPPFSFLGLRQKMGQQKYHPTASSSFPDSVQPSRCMALNTLQATDLPTSEHRDLGSSLCTWESIQRDLAVWLSNISGFTYFCFKHVLYFFCISLVCPVDCFFLHGAVGVQGRRGESCPKLCHPLMQARL